MHTSVSFPGYNGVLTYEEFAEIICDFESPFKSVFKVIDPVKWLANITRTRVCNPIFDARKRLLILAGLISVQACARNDIDTASTWQPTLLAMFKAQEAAHKAQQIASSAAATSIKEVVAHCKLMSGRDVSLQNTSSEDSSSGEEDAANVEQPLQNSVPPHPQSQPLAKSHLAQHDETEPPICEVQHEQRDKAVAALIFHLQESKKGAAREENFILAAQLKETLVYVQQVETEMTGLFLLKTKAIDNDANGSIRPDRFFIISLLCYLNLFPI